MDNIIQKDREEMEKIASSDDDYPVLMINQNRYVNSYYFVDQLSEVLNKNDTIITDMGFSFTSTHQALKVKDGQTFHTNSGHAPMGWGLPAAVGAFCAKNIIKKKNKNRVICLTGDGGFQLNIQELATVMHHKIPMKIFIRLANSFQIKKIIKIFKPYFPAIP